MSATFSESWYKVAPLRIGLRPTVNFRRQVFRGQSWYVLHDPYNGTFFRLTPSYYDFVARLDFSMTVEELWKNTLEHSPESAPGQKDVINLLIKLYRANLLYFKERVDSKALFERGWDKAKKQSKQRWFNFLFIRFPLWNPDKWLDLFLPVWKIIFSTKGFVLWAIVVLLGLKTGIERAGEFSDQAVNILAPDNLFLLYLGIAIIKIFHELGHASICKRFGGEVHTIGIMFLLFIPLPYVDATSSWSFNQKWRRILVSSGGMITEFFLGAVACIIWAYSPPGVIHAISYNMIFAATFSTLMFNANPLMRFDGYYILADLIEIPNLYQKSREQVYSLVQKYVFGLHSKELPSQSYSEGCLLAFYGMASMVYRIVLFAGIGLFLADRYFNIGRVLALIMLFTWLIIPPLKFVKYLLRSPELRPVRVRAVSTFLIFFVAPLVVLCTIPLPAGVTVPGVVLSSKYTDVIAKTSGVVESIDTTPNTWVEKGAILVRLSDAALDFEISILELQLDQMDIAEQQARRERNIDRLPIEKRKTALNKALSQLLERRDALTVRAVESGIWAFPESEMIRKQWIARGHGLGIIINENNFRFDGVIDQENASDLFESHWQPRHVRIKGITDVNYQVVDATIIPHANEVLPSPALGWKGGGPIPLADDDTDGTKSSEPVYLVEANLTASAETDAAIVGLVKHGQTGMLYLEMDPQTITKRIEKYTRQFLQRRYQL